jgi:hypothetical protein
MHSEPTTINQTLTRSLATAFMHTKAVGDPASLDKPPPQLTLCIGPCTTVETSHAVTKCGGNGGNACLSHHGPQPSARYGNQAAAVACPQEREHVRFTWGGLPGTGFWVLDSIHTPTHHASCMQLSQGRSHPWDAFVQPQQCGQFLHLIPRHQTLRSCGKATCPALVCREVDPPCSQRNVPAPICPPRCEQDVATNQDVPAFDVQTWSAGCASWLALTLNRACC